MTPSPPSTLLEEQRLLAAPVLIVVGGLLVVLEGLLFAEVVLVFAGPFLLVMALVVRLRPRYHVTHGVPVLLVALVTFFFGSGGFYIGGILVGIGGIFAIVWTPRPLAAAVPIPPSTSAPPPRS